MAEKRTTPDEDPDGSQQEDNAKRAKQDTMLCDLPVELIELILVKVVAMEVKGMRLAKSVWKDKVDVVINRLEVVSSQWSSVLTTDIFRKEVNRLLDGTAEETIRLEIVAETDIPLDIIGLTTVRSLFYVVRRIQNDQFVVQAFHRNQLAQEIVRVSFPGMRFDGLSGCSRSNSVFVIGRETEGRTIRRIRHGTTDQFWTSLIVSDQDLPPSSLSVTTTGRLAVTSNDERRHPSVRLYSPKGILICLLTFPLDIYDFKYISGASEKLNGNLVFISTDSGDQARLTEVDMGGRVVRQGIDIIYPSRWTSCVVDRQERVVVAKPDDTFELYDREFNRLHFQGPPIPGGDYSGLRSVEANNQVNQVSCLRQVVHRWISSVFVKFRFRY